MHVALLELGTLGTQKARFRSMTCVVVSVELQVARYILYKRQRDLCAKAAVDVLRSEDDIKRS